MSELTKKNDPSDRRCALEGQEVDGEEIECAPLADGNDDWCYGCKFYVCREHSRNYGLMGVTIRTSSSRVRIRSSPSFSTC